MIKRIVVAGCRDYNNYQEAKKFIDRCISNLLNNYELVFVSGGCRGADMLGERYATEHNYSIERYIADWSTFGKKAGPLRNAEMAKICDYVICFWDGKSKGTKNMIDCVLKMDKPIRIKRI